VSATDLLREVVEALDEAGIPHMLVGSFEPSTQRALAERDQFNLIDLTTTWKVDLIIRKDRPFSLSEFDRRVRSAILGVDVYQATAEETVLAKLEWAAMGGSDRQVADAAGVLAVGGDTLDDDLDRWAAELGVVELLARAPGVSKRAASGHRRPARRSCRAVPPAR
jgi:hypothetical protein